MYHFSLIMIIKKEATNWEPQPQERRGHHSRRNLEAIWKQKHHSLATKTQRATKLLRRKSHIAWLNKRNFDKVHAKHASLQTYVEAIISALYTAWELVKFRIDKLELRKNSAG